MCDLVPRQVDHALPAVDLRYQRLERLCQAPRGAAFGDYGLGDNRANGPVAHALDDLQDEVRRRIGGIAPIREQFQHESGRQAAEGSCHVAQDGLEALRVGARHDVNDPAQHPEQSFGLRADPAVVAAALFDRHNQLCKTIRVADDLEQGLKRLLVQLDGVGLEAALNDLVPAGSVPAGALTQDFGVVDLLNLDVAYAGQGPQPGDPALEPDVLRRARQQEQERAPAVGIQTRMNGERANNVIVQ